MAKKDLALIKLIDNQMSLVRPENKNKNYDTGISTEIVELNPQQKRSSEEDLCSKAA